MSLLTCGGRHARGVQIVSVVSPHSATAADVAAMQLNNGQPMAEVVPGFRWQR